MRTLESIQNEISTLENVDTFGTKKEISHLPEVLNDDEHIKYLTSGLMDSTTWLVVCTQKRIVLVDYGFLFGIKQFEMPLDRINSISYKSGLILGSIEIWHGGAKMLIENCSKESIKPFVDSVNDAIKKLKETDSQSTIMDSTKQNSTDTVSQLERLAALLEKGILTKEEFAEQKKKILAQ